MERISLENHLFTWDGWDENGIMSPMFYKVELKVPIGQFPVGHTFDVAVLDGEKSLITFIDEDETSHTFELGLTVGKSLSDEEVSAAYQRHNPEEGCQCGGHHE